MVPANERLEAESPESGLQTSWRRLMLRDGLVFLSLTAVTLVLAGVTTLLFRSFQAHREALAEDASTRGRVALQEGKPADAVEDFRTALEFRRGDGDDQLALARALAASGHLDQAESYFLNLWQAKPGDGSINLELARLKRQQGQVLDAIQYYRAAVFGTWSGDAPKRRRDIRLELSGYLISIGQGRAARAELLLASGNNPDAATQTKIADLLDGAGDVSDALVDYRNAAADPTTQVRAQEKIAELCYRVGDYDCAERAAAAWLDHAGKEVQGRDRMATMKHDAERLQELSTSPALPVEQRVRHEIANARTVQLRLAECVKTQASDGLSQLQTDWKSLDTAKNRAALLHDNTLEDQYRSKVFSTEHAVSSVCGAPTGDDALLLYLEAHPAIHAGGQQ